MRRDVAYRGWIIFACACSILSGAALWFTGERSFAVLGIVAGVFHALWGLDVRALMRGRWQRRAIVIPQLRPMVVSLPQQGLTQRLRAWWRRHG